MKSRKKGITKELLLEMKKKLDGLIASFQNELLSLKTRIASLEMENQGLREENERLSSTVSQETDGNDDSAVSGQPMEEVNDDLSYFKPPKTHSLFLVSLVAVILFLLNIILYSFLAKQKNDYEKQLRAKPTHCQYPESKKAEVKSDDSGLGFRMLPDIDTDTATAVVDMASLIVLPETPSISEKVITSSSHKPKVRMANKKPANSADGLLRFRVLSPEFNSCNSQHFFGDSGRLSFVMEYPTEDAGNN